MGTPTGAAKAREAREKKARAARRARRAAYEAEQRALDVAETLPAHQSLPTDGALTRVDAGNDQQPQQVAAELLRNAAPIAALTVSQAMTDKRAPWAVRLQAALGVLDSQGLREQPKQPEQTVEDFDERQLRAFMEAGARALSLRRARESAEDAQVIEGR